MSRLQAALDGVTEEPSKVETRPIPTKAKKTSREKTVLIGGHFSPEVQKQLRMIAAEEGTTNQALLAEALNLLFRKKGKDAIV
jgi:hypothetical protein